METGIYGRVSTEEQALEGYSIRGQVEKLQQYVSAKSWSIYDVYLDEGISGKNMTERPAITRMIKDIKAGHVKNVLVFKLDRLTRSVADLVYLIDLFNVYGCAFNSLSESIDTSTASGRMFIKIIGIFAEFERENIGERVRLGKERKAREGFTTACASISYGYDRPSGEKVQKINKAEAEVVKRIFDMYINQNMSITQVAKTLNIEKIPSKQGRTWNTGVITNLLSNPNYIGSVRYGTTQPERYFEVEGKHKAIITEDVFQEAQLLLSRNKRTCPTKKPVEGNYFSGLIYCGVCGLKRVSHTSYTGKDKSVGYYSFVCKGYNLKACDAKKISARKLERVLLEYLTSIPDTALDNEQVERTKAERAAQIVALQERIKTLDAKEKEMLDSYIEDNASLAEYRGVKVQLDGERAKLLAEIEKLTPTEIHNIKGSLTQEEIISAFKKHWIKYSDKKKRQFLLKHINKIVVINQPIKGRREGKCEITNIEFNT